MDYFIFKEISSQDFDGLVVSSLPPITKPSMRVEEITIDGKDGSQYKELGYSSYEKTIEIVKLKEIDIEEIKSWLDGEGRLILSNERDKYYNAKIIEDIDYSRFKLFNKDKITFSIQPFKYSLIDTKKTYNIDEEQQIIIRNNGNVNSKPLITITGTGIINLSLNGEQLFIIDMSSEQEITIDLEDMNAYNNTTKILKNRLIIGNYDNFQLKSGKNIISWTGTITKIEIENYSRWI